MNHRIQWIDTTKVLTIFLILFVHLIESFHDAGTENLLPTIKLLHSFLLFFFFLTTGFFLKPKHTTFWGELKYRFLVRIIPVVAFGLLLLPFNFVLEHNVNIMQHGALKITLMYLAGLPVLNWTTWFLVALFTAELICYFFPPQKSAAFKLCGVVVLYSLGWWLSEKSALTVFIISGAWFVREALIISAILIIGNMLKPYVIALSNRGILTVFLCFAITLTITLLTFDLNQVVLPPAGHRPMVVDRATVIMAIGRHGDYFWFFLTGLSGGLMCIFAGMLIPSFKPIPYLARNSLLLIGLIGFFFHFINNPFAERLSSLSSSAVMSLAIGFSLIQLLLCIPAIWLLDTYFPQLFGKPATKGPLLPPLTKSEL